MKEPTPGTLHRQPFLVGAVELAIGAVLERVLVVVLVLKLVLVLVLDEVAEVVLLEDMLLFILEVELGTLHASI